MSTRKKNINLNKPRHKSKNKLRNKSKNNRNKKKSKIKYKIGERIISIKASGKCPKRKPFLDGENIYRSKCSKVYEPSIKQYQPYDMLVGTECNESEPFNLNGWCTNVLNVDVGELIKSQNMWDRHDTGRYISERVVWNGVPFDIVMVRKGTYMWRGASYTRPYDINNFYGKFDKSKYDVLPTGILWFGSRKTGLEYAKDYGIGEKIETIIDQTRDYWNWRGTPWRESRLEEKKNYLTELYELIKDKKYKKMHEEALKAYDFLDDQSILYSERKRLMKEALDKIRGYDEYLHNNYMNFYRLEKDVILFDMDSLHNAWVSRKVMIDGESMFDFMGSPMLSQDDYQYNYPDASSDPQYDDFEIFKRDFKINRESEYYNDAKALSAVLKFGFNGWIYFGENKDGEINKGTQGLSQEMNIADAENYVKHLFSYPTTFGELKESKRE